jgi:hypothetical protein
VYESETNKTLSQVQVTTKNSTHSVTTDIDGYYLLPNVKAGEYTLIAEKVGYYNDTIDVSVDTGLTTQGDFILSTIKPPGIIRGTVTDNSNGLPIVGAEIVTTPYVGSVNTDENGDYEIADVPYAIYKVKCKAANFDSLSFSVEIVPDTVVIVDFAMTPSYGIITGYVTYIDTLNIIQPVVGANISTTPATSVVSTDSSGYYTIIDVPQYNQSYKVLASRLGFKDTEVSVDPIMGKTVTANILMVQDP